MKGWILRLVILAALVVMSLRLLGQPAWKVTDRGEAVQLDGGATFVVRKIAAGSKVGELRLVLSEGKMDGAEHARDHEKEMICCQLDHFEEK